jgi:hypothetical protein
MYLLFLRVSAGNRQYSQMMIISGEFIKGYLQSEQSPGKPQGLVWSRVKWVGAGSVTPQNLKKPEKEADTWAWERNTRGLPDGSCACLMAAASQE